MGGKNVYSDHKDCIRRRHCNYMKGGFYSVDFTYQLYRIMIGIKNKRRNGDSKIHHYIDINLIDPHKTKTLDELIEYEDKVAHLIATCSFIETCIDKCIFTVQVFDGKPPDLKRKKLEERRRSRERAIEESSKIEDKTSEDYMRQHKRSVGIRDIHYKETIDLIRAMGLIEVQSPGEADPQCAAIASSLHNIDGVISEDSDVLIFGGPKVIKSFSRKSSIVSEISLADILESLKNKANNILRSYQQSEITEFKEEYFVDSRILLGTDYNDPIVGIDPGKLFELYILSNFNVPALIQRLKADQNFQNNPVIIPENFEGKWNEVKKYYLEANVIDPMTIDLKIKLPNLEKMVDILHKRNNFNIKFVRRLYNSLVQMYNLYYSIPAGSSWHNSFRTYQVKFHSSNLKNYLHQYPPLPQSCSVRHSKNYQNIKGNTYCLSKSNKFEVLAY